MFKTCSTCKVEQSLDCFSKNGVSKIGTPLLRSSCKSCESARSKDNRKDVAYVQKEAEAKRKRVAYKKKLEEVRQELTFLVECSICKEQFVITSLPEKPGSISLTCKTCSAGKQESKECQ